MTAAITHNIPLHHRKYGQKDPTRRVIGWIVVAIVHAIVLYGLITGTAMKALKIIKKPLEAAVIQEVIIPPPPPPPLKEIVKPQTPKVEAPPPPFVPPPEVAPPTAPVIQAAQTPPATPPVIAPPPPPAAAPAPISREDIGVACPTQVKPEIPRQATRDGISGVVKVRATIHDGRIVNVELISGPKVFLGAVREAMTQYRCVAAQSDLVATQEFVFKVE